MEVQPVQCTYTYSQYSLEINISNYIIRFPLLSKSSILLFTLTIYNGYESLTRSVKEQQLDGSSKTFVKL